MPLPSAPAPRPRASIPDSKREREAIQRAEMQRALQVLFSAEDVVELRALRASTAAWRSPHTVRGYYDAAGRDALIRDALAIQKADGIYVTLQRLNPDLLARSYNTAEDLVSAKSEDASAKDKDVLRYRWLFIDADPVRVSGISSADAELALAHERMREIEAHLSALGWPEPVWAASGNGSHLLYRIDEPPTEASRINAILTALHLRFSDAAVKIDTTTSNPARICKLYGTFATKGSDMPVRPHRLSHLIYVPDEVRVVPSDLLAALAETAATPTPAAAPGAAPVKARAAGKTTSPTPSLTPSATDPTALDLVKWAKDQNFDLPAPFESATWGTTYRTHPCPCKRACADGAAIIQESSGRILFKCHHDNCEVNGLARSLNSTPWAVLRAQVERRDPTGPRRPQRMQGAAAGRAPSDGDAAAQEPPLEADADGVVAEGSDAGALPDDAAPRVEATDAAGEVQAVGGEVQAPDDVATQVLGEVSAPAPEAKARKQKKKPGKQVTVRAEDLAPRAEGGTRVRSILATAPVPEAATVPRGYYLEEGGVYALGKTADDEAEHISHCPILISARLRDVSGREHLRVSWLREGRWSHRIEPRNHIADRRTILDLAAYGATVTTDNAGAVVRWLAAFESCNLALLPCARVSSQMGWVDDGFLLGSTFVSASGEAVTTDLDAPDTWTESTWAFASPSDEGADADARAFGNREGTFDAWAAALKEVCEYKTVIFSLYAALAAPLVKLLKHRTIIVDCSGPSGGGKSSLLHVAASTCGQPDELSGGIIKPWNVSRAGLGGLAARRNHLPVLLDDTNVAEPEILKKIIYQMTSGQSGTRGKPGIGTRDGQDWRTVFISTGEHRLIDFALASDAGARQRVITINGLPWGGRTPAVPKLRDALAANHGWAMERWVTWLAQNRARAPEWTEALAKHKVTFEALAFDCDAAKRISEDLALIRLCADLVHQALKLPWRYNLCVEDQMAAVRSSTRQATAAEVALLRLWEWAQMYQDLFYGRRDKDGPPPSRWAGAWSPSHAWSEIAFSPGVFRQVLEEHSFKPDSVLEAWTSQGWVIRDGHHIGPKRTAGGLRSRHLVVTRAAIDALTGDETPEGGLAPAEAPAAIEPPPDAYCPF